MAACHKFMWLLLFNSTLVLLFVKQGSSGLSIDLRRTKVWGPGLNADVTLPARYIFIQPFTKDGKKITESLGDNVFTISLASATREHVRYKHTVYGRRDGLYIVVYRLYNTIKDVMIEILHDDQHVALSPYSLTGTLYHEKCNCPQPDPTQWYRDMGCPESYRQLDEDMSIFTSINNEEIVEEIFSRYSNRHKYFFGHYKIINNKIYRKAYGDDTVFKMYSDAILLSLLRKVKLSDTEFVLNLSYFPLETKPETDNNSTLPLFSWYGSDDIWSIMLPSFDLTMSSLEMLGSRPIDIFSVMGKRPVAWKNKTEKGFWRGRDSRQDRLDLVVTSRKYPELIDAKLTKMFFFPHDKEKLGALVSTIPFHDFFRFKYQLNIDGSVASYRLPYLLSGDGVVLKQESPYYEHFYKDLKPYEHYIPVRRDLQDLIQQIKWAKENDDKVMEISKNAQEFTMEMVNPVNVFCYHVKVLEKYTSLLTAPVSPPGDDQWEAIEQPGGIETRCDCERPVMKQLQQQPDRQQHQQQAKQMKEEL